MECKRLNLQDGSAVFPRRPSPLIVLLGLAFAEMMVAPFRVVVRGEEHLRHAPGALILSNHRRDSDGPIVDRVLMQRRGLTLGGVASYIVGREDMFRKGFLDTYLDSWPQPARALLGRICVGPMLRLFRVRPIRRIPEYSMAELLEDAHSVFGDVPLQEILRQDWTERFARHMGVGSDQLSVKQALGASGQLLYQRNAFRRLRRQALRKLMPFERQVIATQLQQFVDLLESGETVFLEPEGTLSPDGHFLRPRQALHYLLNMPRRRPHVLPVALSYDFMRPGKTRALVHVGAPRYDLNGLSRRDTDKAAGPVVLKHWTITLSHLTARYLLERGERRLTKDMQPNFARFLADFAKRCQTLGASLDPDLLDPPARAQRQAECLAFWNRSRNRVKEDDLKYLNNELEAVAALYPGLLPDGLA